MVSFLSSGLTTRISRCLPRGTTSATVHPARFSVAKRGTRKSEAISFCPASAWCSWLAARQTESPSGTDPQPLGGGVGAGRAEGGSNRRIQDPVPVHFLHDQLVHGAAGHHTYQRGT